MAFFRYHGRGIHIDVIPNVGMHPDHLVDKNENSAALVAGSLPSASSDPKMRKSSSIKRWSSGYSVLRLPLSP